jgi:hypothetical protein
MNTRIVLSAIVLAAGSSFAAAQSSTATSGTTAPMTTQPAGQNKVVIPPAARSGEKGLRIGNDAMDAGPIEMKRKK